MYQNHFIIAFAFFFMANMIFWGATNPIITAMNNYKEVACTVNSINTVVFNSTFTGSTCYKGVAKVTYTGKQGTIIYPVNNLTCVSNRNLIDNWVEDHETTTNCFVLSETYSGRFPLVQPILFDRNLFTPMFIGSLVVVSVLVLMFLTCMVMGGWTACRGNRRVS
eukprot:TRINITY_DN5195_c0_g1_i2.p1 TRINITY_DN5195_c0_g1~~TRINITY_DN5195_c0_g1_i2.p1  ORF type:complete len:179 (-),score=4.02 TRINITY_DN5195_c0_g1_i2:64-558(-)